MFICYYFMYVTCTWCVLMFPIEQTACSRQQMTRANYTHRTNYQACVTRLLSYGLGTGETAFIYVTGNTTNL